MSLWPYPRTISCKPYPISHIQNNNLIVSNALNVNIGYDTFCCEHYLKLVYCLLYMYTISNLEWQLRDRWVGLYNPGATCGCDREHPWQQCLACRQQWAWADGAAGASGAPLSYTNWSQLEPELCEACGRIRDDGLWSGYPCTGGDNFKFICKMGRNNSSSVWCSDSLKENFFGQRIIWLY